MLAAAGIAVLVLRPSAEDGGAGETTVTVQGVRVDVDPVDGVGSCPVARYEFTGVIDTDGGSGPVEVAWTRPDGRDTDPAVLDVGAGQGRATAVLTFEVTGELPLEGPAVLRVLSPQQLTAQSAPIRYSC